MTSLIIEHFGLFGIPQHGLHLWRILEGALITGGIVLLIGWF